MTTPGPEYLNIDPATRDQWVCATCRRPLDAHERIDRSTDTLIGFFFEHAARDLPADHEAVPVRAEDTGGEVVGVCDFCSAPGPTWCFVVADFGLATPPLGAALGVDGFGSVGDWSACDACHRDVVHADWNKVAYRALRRHPARLRPMLEPEVRRFHRGFRDHWHGEVRPLLAPPSND